MATLDPSRYNLLVEFAIRHTAFHRAELESVLSISGIVIGRDCDIVELPCNTEHTKASDPSVEARGADESKKHDDANSDDKRSSKKRPRDDQDPCTEFNGNAKNTTRSFIVLSFPMSSIGTKFRHDVLASPIATSQQHTDLPDAAAVLSRCVLIRSVVELWGAGTTIESCADSVQKFAQCNKACDIEDNDDSSSSNSDIRRGASILAPHQTSLRSWKMTVHTLGSKYTREEQNDMRHQFAFLQFDGPIKMECPDDEFILIREVALDDKGGPIYPRHSHGRALISENESRPPLAAYFGRILGSGRNWRSDLERYSLKKRLYLGPTSMDAELSLVMTNLARVTNKNLAFDPFVGTGSILLSCGLRGARCVGTDIDIRVLRGEGKEEDVFSNFRQYDLPRPELIRSDNSLYHRHYRLHPPLYDAIVTDPPYGIRAGARKSGSKRDEVRAVAKEHRHDHIAQTRPYAVSDVMADLLDVSSRTLAMGGRLVYVIPSMTDFDEATDLPRHDCLKLVYTCYQPLSAELGRRMVTMEKVADYDEMKREEYMARVWVNGPQSAEKCANIRDRIIEAAKQKPGYEEKAAIRREKRRATKQARRKTKCEIHDTGDRNKPT